MTSSPNAERHKATRHAQDAHAWGRSGRKGGDDMLFSDSQLFELSELRSAELRRSLRRERLVRAARSAERPSRSRAVRRVFGQSLVRVGSRLAAEPDLRPARSR
jgi:hypothetical protein